MGPVRVPPVTVSPVARVAVVVRECLMSLVDDGGDTLPLTPDARGTDVAGSLRRGLGPLVDDVPDSRAVPESGGSLSAGPGLERKAGVWGRGTVDTGGNINQNIKEPKILGGKRDGGPEASPHEHGDWGYENTEGGDRSGDPRHPRGEEPSVPTCDYLSSVPLSGDRDGEGAGGTVEGS